MLKQYAEKHAARFHMPGHKGVPARDADFLAAVFPYDITELDFSDNLAEPKGCLAKAQDLYAEVYGAKKCLFSVNGATCGVLALVSAAKGKVMAERASHISVFNALELRGERAVIINNKYRGGKFAPLSFDEVKRALDANPDVKTLVMTSPNYYGETGDVDEISRHCAERGVALIIDMAHGAHFAFTPLIKNFSDKCAACVVSAHKTLPAMTQTAAVLINDVEMFDGVNAAMRVFHTSSPSYVLMASLDYARDALLRAVKKGEDKRVFDAVEDIKRASGHTFLKNDDFTRLVLEDTDGKKAAEYFMSNGVVPEFHDTTRVVFILSLAESRENLLKLKSALTRMPAFDKPRDDFSLTKPLYSEASFCHGGQTEWVGLDEADGRVCAGRVGRYPPGVPLFTRGEVISGAADLARYDNLFGVTDGKIKVYK